MNIQTCGVPDCERTVRCKGLCGAHYRRRQKTGSVVNSRGETAIGKRAQGDVAARFAAHHDSGSDCWEWTGSTDSKGYGRFWTGGRLVQAHRWSYEHHVGPIPAHLQLDHKCRNPPCVNPAHLEPVTSRVNHMRSPGVANGTKTHCPAGHEYTPENTLPRRRPDGGVARQCRPCVNAYRREYHHRRREAAGRPAKPGRLLYPRPD